jgi:superfamily II DNA or RNA helicase
LLEDAGAPSSYMDIHNGPESITDYHACYLAHELTKRSPSDNVGKLTQALADAQVDLNPHQVEAALFAFRNPFSKGAILADEVGLGKTIEAGLILSQKWAERKRTLLIIMPANLRKQWSQELADKFFLPSIILEAKSFNEEINRGNLNPFQQNCIIICSYQFAKSKEPYLRQTPWDLVVIDEAHRLRNVYKGTSKIATSIKYSVAPFPKLLLTATPLQNSLLELYGLVSIIDDYAFGDQQSFRSRFSRLAATEDYEELKERLKPICKRTLRRQVLEYVPYTNRHALVQEFVPTTEEQQLYDLVSEYLQGEKLYALPSSQRKLITLVLLKLQASSTYAISETLRGMVGRLDKAELKAEGVTASPEELTADLDTYDELADEWDEDPGASTLNTAILDDQQLAELKAEKAKINEIFRLAESIVKNAKGEVLLTALRRGFRAAAKAQEQQGQATLQNKAIIFTESRRTQEYLFRILEETEFAGKVMLFNGTNTDPLSKEIYQAWLNVHAGTDRITGSKTADMRQALVDHFRDTASILIATEAAAEGINLQFCNLVVNYDLPWNPQRIEQRIGRCHRYGQKFDVVVVNFLNKSNAADVRVYELLDEKFKLFNGVFGASDDVLGAVESGIEFEKRIVAIYQKSRSPQQIAFEFDELQKEFETEISQGQRSAREKLLDNFDQEVVEKVRVESKIALDRFQNQLWKLTRHVLKDAAEFDESAHLFRLKYNPFKDQPINAGPYHVGKSVPEANTYRIGHPLAKCVIAKAIASNLPAANIVFDYAGARRNISVLQRLVGSSGYLCCSKVTFTALETEDRLILAGMTDDGISLDEEICRRLFDLPANVCEPIRVPDDISKALSETIASSRYLIADEVSARNGVFFDAEMDKLDHWAEDRRNSLKSDLLELDEAIKSGKKSARLAGSLPDKLEKQRQVRTLETKRDEAWRAYDQASRDVDRQKDLLLDDISSRLDQSIEEVPLFTFRWTIV